MATGKKGVIVYVDWGELFDNLQDDEAGRLIKHFFNYVRDMNPAPPDRLTELSFIPIKQSLKRDLEKWEDTIESRSKAGKASAEARAKQKSTNPTRVDCVEQKSTNPTVIVNVNDNVTDNVNVSDSEARAIKANGKVFFVPDKLDDFKPPTFAEVKECFAKQKPSNWDYAKSYDNAEKFHTHYESNGWTINGTKIGNWQATVKKWILREIDKPKNNERKQTVAERQAEGLRITKESLESDLREIDSKGIGDYPPEVYYETHRPA